MGTIVQLVIRWRAGVEEDCGTVGLHRMDEVIVVRGNMHCNFSERVILNIDSVASKLVGIQE